MAKENPKNTNNIILVSAALLLLGGIVVYAWNLPKSEGDKTTSSECNVQVKEGTAADVDKLGPNEVQITAQNFDAEVIKTPGIVLVDAYAPWCPHCQKLAPVITKIADDYVGKVKVGRMNANNQDPATKENFDFAMKNGLTGYPAVWIYKDGKMVDSFSGFRNYCEIKEILDKYVN